MLDTIDTAPLSREEFTASLLDAIGSLRAEDTRLYRLLMARRCPPAVLRRYAESTVASADLFTGVLADMVASAPDAHARVLLLENLLEEEGISLIPSRGLLHREETSHPALARRFARAVGACENPSHADPATYGGRALLEEGRWLDAVAFLLLGQELHFADAAPALAQALEHAGVARHDLAFFWVHKTADREHGEQALEIVVRNALTRQQQDSCLAQARAGAEAWMQAHGGRAH